jgi:superfamily II DNA or RNA helicase
MKVTIDYDSGRKKGILITDYLSNIREYFSVEDKNQNFKRRFTVGYRPSARQYAITPQGRFEPRLAHTILEYLHSLEIPLKVEVTDKFKEFIYSPHLWDEDKDIVTLGMSLRDYQYETVKAALKNKSGIIILPTSAGKTFVMATIVRSIQQQQDNLKTLILVPDIQLVTQSYSDFIEYGIPENEITKWTGSYEPDSNASIVIANIQILQSEKQDLSLLKDIKLLIVDEVHKLKHGNKVNKIIDQITAKYRFGLTGTMPDTKIDEWNIIGKLGKIIYKKQSIDLRDQNYISQVHVAILKVNYWDLPTFTRPSATNPTAGYEEEIHFLQNSEFRNNLITKIVNGVDKNTLIMVDRIIHGEILLLTLTKNTKKKVYFVHGDIEIEERENIRRLMEEEDDVICVAISKIFSTGINIKNLHNIVFASIGKAKIKIIQSIGRSLRKHASKKRATIFDIGDNLRYGNAHLAERIDLYNEEQIPYSVTEITQS